MKYQPPLGVSNPDAPYINGDPTIGRQGSIPPDHAFEYPMREIVGVISKSFMNPSDADLLQMTKAVRSQRLNYAEDTGPVNALVVAYDPPLTAYTLGLILHVRVRNRCTNEGVTINAGAGTANVVRPDGSILQDGDLPANSIAGLVYDGTSFQLLNFGGQGGTAGGGDTVNNTYITKLPYVRDTGTVPGQIIAPFNPVYTELVEGDAFLVKLKQTCPGVSTIRVNALPPKPVLASDSSQCLQGDYVAGDVKLFVYDGTQFYIHPNPLVTASFTMNVPAQYASFDAAQNALQRKLIHKDARVTIKFPAGGYNPGPISINHVSASQIIVAGTMIGPPPAAAEFVPGNPNQNLAMYRSRYGTEVHSTGVCIQNIGPGSPVVQDMLMIADGPGVIGVGCDVGFPQVNEAINGSNLAAWGCNIGYYGHGPSRFNACSATACNVGFGAVNGGSMHTGGCHSMGNNYHGYMATSHSEFVGSASSCQWNGSAGAYAGDGSYISLNNQTMIQNGVDAYASNGSIINLGGNSAIYTSSPERNVEGNMSSVVCG
jgi:hypothetical protein